MPPAKLANSVMDLVDLAGDQGTSMGALVDQLEKKGHAASDVELEIWNLMSKRELTPSGFICRSIRRNGSLARTTERAYEFLLVRWSRELDGQLELDLGSGAQ